MTIDLREALDGAVADAPGGHGDLRAVVDAGSRRIRRRRLLVTGGTAAAVAAVVGAVALTGSIQPHRETLPSKVVHLDLDHAVRLDPEVLDSVRGAPSTSRKLDQQPLGITPDGMVVRYQRYRDGGQRVGLLDPGTGATRWSLMPSTPSPVEPAALTAASVVLWDRRELYRVEVLTLDRASGEWARTTLHLERGIEVHGPPQVQLGGDGRYYVGSNLEDEPFEKRWWSYGPDGGRGRPEPGLTGRAMTWADGRMVSADADGRVVVSGDGVARVVSRARPAGCDRPEPAFIDAVGLAGDGAVVTYWCDGNGPVTVVAAADQVPIQVAGSMAVAAGQDRVLLQGAIEEDAGGDGTYWASDENTYLLDPSGPTLGLIESRSSWFGGELGAGLVMWSATGGSGHETDVVWRVARLP